MIVLFLSTPTRKVTVRGSATKTVKCEVCGCAYSYRITREAEGTDKALFSWTNRGAMLKAEANAWKNLDAALESEDEAIPCPDCNWVQHSMIRAVKNRSYRGLSQLANVGFVFGIGLFAIVVLFTLAQHIWFRHKVADPEASFSVLAALGGIVAALGCIPAGFCWAIRRLLLSQYDPNRGAELCANPDARFAPRPFGD